jgi:hypothetical protein
MVTSIRDVAQDFPSVVNHSSEDDSYSARSVLGSNSQNIDQEGVGSPGENVTRLN